MKKRIIVIILCFAAVSVAAVVFYFTNMQKEFVPLESVELLPGHVYNKVTSEGKIGVRNTYSVAIESSQAIEKVHIKEGDAVKEGDLLITYSIESDKKDIERQLKEAELNLSNARLNLSAISTPASGNELVQYENDVLTANKNIDDVKAEIESIELKIEQQQIKLDDARAIMEKNKILLDDGGISKKAYDDSVTTFQLYESTMKDLQTQKEQKEGTLKTREQQLSYSNQKLENAKDRLMDESTAIKYQIQQNTIELYSLAIEKLVEQMDKLTEASYAPASGDITKINIEDGQTAGKNTPLIVISDSSDRICKVELSEFDAPYISHGLRAEITTSGISGKVFAGTVTKISNEAVEKESSSDNEIIVPVEISIDNIDERLKTGFSVDVDIYIDERQNVNCLPLQCIFEDEGVKYIYVIENEAYVKKPVETGLYGDKSVEITGGISEGEKVVLSPWDVQ